MAAATGHTKKKDVSAYRAAWLCQVESGSVGPGLVYGAGLSLPHSPPTRTILQFLEAGSRNAENAG